MEEDYKRIMSRLMIWKQALVVKQCNFFLIQSGQQRSETIYFKKLESPKKDIKRKKKLTNLRVELNSIIEHNR